MRLSGRLRSAVIIGLQGIRARKLRTLLSMISLFMGVLAVVTVQAGANTAERALVANVELSNGIDGTREMYTPPVPGGSEAVLGAIKGRSDAVALTSVNAIIGEPNVTPVNPGGGPFERLLRPERLLPAGGHQRAPTAGPGDRAPPGGDDR
jgi:macrolide transport system ATP-binding/permease protein